MAIGTHGGRAGGGGTVGDEVRGVQLRAQLLRVRTRADRTTDITLNIPEDCRAQAAKLFEWIMDEVETVIVRVDTNERPTNTKRAKY